MKRVILFSLLIQSVIFAQLAEDYFPSPGYTWRYDVIPLDSLNSNIDSLAFVEIDSFAVVSNYVGREANVVLSKSGPSQLINTLPFIDTSYYDMDGSEGWEYFKITGLDSLVSGLDSTLGITFLELLESFQDWYSIYRFGQTVNSTYQIFQYDTVITYNGTPLDMRFRMEGKRLQDENLNTAIGDFNCKKFIINSKVIYLFLGIIPVTIVDLADTNWIAPENWIVKRFTPSTTVDLSFAGMPAFTIPGLKYDIAEPLPTGTYEEQLVPSAFLLDQNYPNPFNPSTHINYRINQSGIASIKVYNVLGKEIMTLVNEQHIAGEYTVTFNAGNLPAGVYYYRLTSEGNNEVKKMILLK